MVNRLLSMMQTAEDLRHEDYKDRIKARNKMRAKIILVLFGLVAIGCLFVRIIT